MVVHILLHFLFRALCLNVNSFRHDSKSSTKNPHILYRVLAQHKAPLLPNFRLTVLFPSHPFHLNTWVHTVTACNVQQFHLEIYHFDEELFELPRCVFTCKTVSILKLRIDIVLNPPSFQLPSLKILCLHKILYRSDDSFSRLLSGCPALEDLTVSFKRRFGWCHQF